MGVVTLDLTDGGGLPGEGKAQLVGKVTKFFHLPPLKRSDKLPSFSTLDVGVQPNL